MKKVLAFLLAAVMLVAMFTACSKQTVDEPAPSEQPAQSDSDQNTNTPAAENNAEETEKPHITIAYIAEANYPVADPENWGPCKQLEEDLGIDVEWLDWGNDTDNYIEKLDLAVASGDAPDIFVMNEEQVNKYLAQDALLCIDDYMDNYPNLKKWIDNDVVRGATTYAADGKLYSAVRQYSEQIYYFGMLGRQDVLNDLGINYDGTTEGFLDMLRQLKEETGVAPFTFRHGVENLVGYFGPTFGLPSYCNAYDYQGPTQQFIVSAIDDRLFTELQFLNTMYSEGLLDPEYALNTTDMWVEKMSSDQGFVTYDYLVRCEGLTNAVREENPDSAYEIRAIDLPVSPDGYHPGGAAIPTLATHAQWGINADTKYPEACMAALDYVYRDDIINWANYGEEGVTYDVVDGNIVFNENVPTADNNFTTPGDPIDVNEYRANRVQFFGQICDSEAYAKTYYGKYSYAGYERYKEKEWNDPASPIIPSIYYEEGEREQLADLQTALKDFYIAECQSFIEGSRPLTADEYAKFQQEILEDYGGNEIMRIQNTAYQKWQAAK